jgi:hypothetical protein
LLSEDGTEAPLVIATKDNRQCKLNSASMWAAPRPDGSSRVHLTVDRSKDFSLADNPSPKALIGTTVYGLREKPFLAPPDCEPKDPVGDLLCSYEFEAQTDELRAAQIFFARDIAWDRDGVNGRIEFDPSFLGLAAFKSQDDSDTPGDHELWYELTGKDLSPITHTSLTSDSVDSPGCWFGSCLGLYSENDGSKPMALTMGDSFIVIDDSTIWFKAKPLKSVRLVWRHDYNVQPITWSLAVKAKDKAKITSDTPLLYVSDTRAVKFEGRDFSQLISLTFDGESVMSAVLQKDKKSITIQIPTKVTAKPGYKEMVATVPDDKNKPTPVALPVSVALR